MLADGLGKKVNDEGIAFYNNVINTLLEKGMNYEVDFFLISVLLHH